MNVEVCDYCQTRTKLSDAYGKRLCTPCEQLFFLITNDASDYAIKQMEAYDKNKALIVELLKRTDDKSLRDVLGTVYVEAKNKILETLGGSHE